MKMSLERTNGWRLRSAPFEFQQTYHTSLDNLSAFVHSLLAPFTFTDAELRIETWVFTPEAFLQQLQTFDIAASSGDLNGAIIHAQNRNEAETLLEAALGEWMDFAFFPISGDFAIYSDHDEYTTVFTKTQQAMTSLSESMMQQGFKLISDWMWTGPHSAGALEEGNTNV